VAARVPRGLQPWVIGELDGPHDGESVAPQGDVTVYASPLLFVVPLGHSPPNLKVLDDGKMLRSKVCGSPPEPTAQNEHAVAVAAAAFTAAATAASSSTWCSDRGRSIW
jgi:hypothetical protein